MGALASSERWRNSVSSLAHRGLEAQQQTVVGQARIVHTAGVDEERAESVAERTSTLTPAGASNSGRQ